MTLQNILTAINIAALRRVRILFFLGDDDDNDAVNHIDSYSYEQSELIKRRFGKALVEAMAISASAPRDKGGTNKVYHGVGHKVTSGMWDDILDYFRKALAENDAGIGNGASPRLSRTRYRFRGSVRVTSF